jgi:hypothetical protein
MGTSQTVRKGTTSAAITRGLMKGLLLLALERLGSAPVISPNVAAGDKKGAPCLAVHNYCFQLGRPFIVV